MLNTLSILHRKASYFLSIVCRLFITTVVLYSQQLWAQSPPSSTLNSQEIKLLIDSLKSSLKRNYVYADKANKYVAVLESNSKKQKYSVISSRSVLVESLLKDLQSINRDEHLRLGYFPKVAADLEIKNQDSLRALDFDLSLAQAKERNFYFIRKEVLPGNIGYMRFDGFDEHIVEAAKMYDTIFESLRNCENIVLDLRYNYGGSVDMATHFVNYFLDKKTPLNFLITRNHDTIKRYSTPEKSGIILSKPLYILIGPQTASAAEDFSYNLQQCKRAKIVGDTSCGAAHTVVHYSLGQGYVIRMPSRYAYNAYSNSNWEGSGIFPDVACESEKALSVVLEKIYLAQIQNEKDAFTKKVKEGYLQVVRNGKYLGQAFLKQKYSDANYALQIKDSIVGPINVGIGFGSKREYHLKTTFLDKGAPIYINEGNSAWFKISFTKDTLLTFDLVPTDAADDYDFILFKCNASNCVENITNNLLKVDRECHSGFASFNGATGLSKHATANSVTLGPGATYASALPVKAGESYYLMVFFADSYTKEGKVPHGFTLYFHDYWPKKKPRVLQNINFNTNASELLPSSYSSLDNLVKELKDNKSLSIEISGHTDNDGNEAMNQELSTNRALAVKAYLVQKGIDAKRLQCKGYGSTRPLRENNSSLGKQQNRRVEIAVIMK